MMGTFTRNTSSPARPSQPATNFNPERRNTASTVPEAAPAVESKAMPSEDCCSLVREKMTTMCDLLSECIGYYIIAQHLVGTSSLEIKEGLLVRVESNAYVLYDEMTGNHLFCDYYSLKFFYRLPIHARRKKEHYEEATDVCPEMMSFSAPYQGSSTSLGTAPKY